MRLTTAEMIAAIEACVGRVEITSELVPYDGPEPTQEYLTGAEADRRAGVEQDRLWRSLP